MTLVPPALTWRLPASHGANPRVELGLRLVLVPQVVREHHAVAAVVRLVVELAEQVTDNAVRAVALWQRPS